MVKGKVFLTPTEQAVRNNRMPMVCPVCLPVAILVKVLFSYREAFLVLHSTYICPSLRVYNVLSSLPEWLQVYP